MADAPVKTEIEKPAGTPAPAAEPTQDVVIEKVQKGEKLSEQENEVFKSLPKESLPGSVPLAQEAPAAPAAGAPAPAAKKEEAPAPAAGTITDERKKLIEAEVSKPRSMQDLTKFSQTELSLYWELKKVRRKNQALEDELEVTRIEQIVSNLKNKGEKKPAEAPAAEDPMKALEGLEGTDIVTVDQVKKIVEGLKPKAPEATQPPLRTTDQIKLERVEAAQNLAAKGITDFNDVIDFAKVALEGDADAAELLRETAREGGNTVEQTYFLIKGSKAWPTIEKFIKDQKGGKPAAPAPSPEAAAAAERIEANEKKVKTTGPTNGAPATPGEYTVQEIQSMTAAQIRKLPKETRKKILEKFGSTPNFSQ